MVEKRRANVVHDGETLYGTRRRCCMEFEVQMETPWVYLRIELRKVVNTVLERNHPVEIGRNTILEL